MGTNGGKGKEKCQWGREQESKKEKEDGERREKTADHRDETGEKEVGKW